MSRCRKLIRCGLEEGVSKQVHQIALHRFKDLIERAEVLERFLMDTLLYIEAEPDKEQAWHVQVLTQLAFIYVPLSFVNGVFGMNVKEINSPPLPVWVVVVALTVTVACTAAALFGSYK